jgi:hypothetical protein
VAAEGLGNVENFYVVLKPKSGKFRLINVGRKRLPDVEGHERNWGFVDMIAKSGKEIEEELQRDTYETKRAASGSGRRRVRRARASTP